jgi:hypothetical protein
MAFSVRFIGVDAAILEQHAHLSRPRWARRRARLRRGIDDLALPRIAGPARDVVDQEGVLERRAGAFHLGRGAGEDPGAAFSVNRLAACQVRAAYSGPA